MDTEHTVITNSIDSNEEIAGLTRTCLVHNFMLLLISTPTPRPFYLSFEVDDVKCKPIYTMIYDNDLLKLDSKPFYCDCLDIVKNNICISYMLHVFVNSTL